MPPLLDGGQHGVAGYGTLSVGEATDGNIFRHTVARMLHGVEDTDCRIVVDGKESVRRIVDSHDRGCDMLGIVTVVAHDNHILIDRHPMFQQGILITVVTVLGDLKLHRTAIEGDTLATRLDEIGYGIIGTHIVIDHHTAGIHTCTDAIIEYQRDTCVDQFLVMGIVLGVLGLRHDDAAHLRAEEVLADAHLALVLLATQCHHDTEAPGFRRLLDTCQDRGEVIMGELRHDDADDTLRHHPTVAQRLTNGIGIEIVVAGILLDRLAALLADTGGVFQGTRHRRHRDPELPGDILHCHWCLIFHCGF